MCVRDISISSNTYIGQYKNQLDLQQCFVYLNNAIKSNLICMRTVEIRIINPIQAGVFWNHIGWRGTLCPPLFLLYLWSNYNQTWHGGTLGQNLSKAINILLTSSAGGKYDVIKPFLYHSKSKFEFPYLLSNGAEIWHRGQF